MRIGHAEALMLGRDRTIEGPAGLDISPIFHVPTLPEDAALRNTTGQDHGLERASIRS
ncbi:MAG: hypothetical protein R2693_06600 [Nocardioidaceae bacterium]